MKIVLLRFVVVWLVTHVILFFVERYRYKRSDWSWHNFKNNGMLNITCTVLTIDRIGGCLVILVSLLYWILQPIII